MAIVFGICAAVLVRTAVKKKQVYVAPLNIIDKRKSAIGTSEFKNAKCPIETPALRKGHKK